jgi:outer membrane protein assembly factor BamB
MLLVFSSFPMAVVLVGASSSLDDYGNLVQYEWPQIHGDSGLTRFSEGPAPESPDILWKTTIEGIESYVAAFNGKVFVTTATDVIALDKDTGSIVWSTTLPDHQRWPAVFKIDESRLIISKYCLETETGTILWESEDFSAKVSYWAESVYSAEEQMFYTHGDSAVLAWDVSDMSASPVLVWETYVSGATGSLGRRNHRCHVFFGVLL